jgi:hypothetical protein
MAYVHFTAFNDPQSREAKIPGRLPTLIPAPSPAPTQRPTGQWPICQVRACLVNGGESGGIYCADAPGNNTPDPKLSLRSKTSRPSAWVVPGLTEVVPTWYVGVDGEPLTENSLVQYPAVYGWLSNVTGLLDKQQAVRDKRQRRNGGAEIIDERLTWDVWMDVDFPPFKVDIQELVLPTPVLTTKVAVLCGLVLALIVSMTARFLSSFERCPLGHFIVRR